MAQNASRSALSPENLGLLEAVSRLGSMAAAARELGMVPSALTYRVRQIEDALDVLLFDRSARRAKLTPAGAELLRSGQYLLDELDAVAERVKRVATGWEPQLTIAADAVISRSTLFELCEAFYDSGAPTRLRLRSETLTGTIDALRLGQADLALGIPMMGVVLPPEIQTAEMGGMDFVYSVAPHHPLANAEEPICTEHIRQYRAVAVADSTPRGSGLSVNLQPGQDVLTVPTMLHKLEAQLRGLGAGFLPLPLVKPYVDAGLLVIKQVERPSPTFKAAYAWRQARGPGSNDVGRALSWWLNQLRGSTTRDALLNRHHQQT